MPTVTGSPTFCAMPSPRCASPPTSTPSGGSRGCWPRRRWGARPVRPGPARRARGPRDPRVHVRAQPPPAGRHPGGGRRERGGGVQRRRAQGCRRAGRRIHAYAVFGSVDIDLSEAIFEYQQVVIKAISVFGNVEIKVPENVVARQRRRSPRQLRDAHHGRGRARRPRGLRRGLRGAGEHRGAAQARQARRRHPRPHDGPRGQDFAQAPRPLTPAVNATARGAHWSTHPHPVLNDRLRSRELSA